MVPQVCRSVELSVFSYANLSGLVWIRPRSCAGHVIQRTFPVWYMCISKNGHAVTNLSSEDRFHKLLVTYVIYTMREYEQVPLRL